jgi:hypothetical protein
MLLRPELTSVKDRSRNRETVGGEVQVGGHPSNSGITCGTNHVSYHKSDRVVLSKLSIPMLPIMKRDGGPIHQYREKAVRLEEQLTPVQKRDQVKDHN